MELVKQLEAILFYKAEPMKISHLADLLEVSIDTILTELDKLEEKLKDHGIKLAKKDDQVALTTTEEASAIIEKYTKEEFNRELGKASIETLAIIAYKKSVSRAEIDYIRGVNSSFILRNLMIRGLIERVINETDSRGFLYRPTFDMLNYLGVSKLEDLPEFAEVAKELSDIKEDKDETQN